MIRYSQPISKDSKAITDQDVNREEEKLEEREEPVN